MTCPTCHAYFDCNPRLLAIKKNGTIQLFGLAKEQKYKNLAGKKVPWANKIDTKNRPTSALLDIVYRLPPKAKKRTRTDLDAGIVDAIEFDIPFKPTHVQVTTKKTCSKSVGNK